MKDAIENVVRTLLEEKRALLADIARIDAALVTLGQPAKAKRGRKSMGEAERREVSARRRRKKRRGPRRDENFKRFVRTLPCCCGCGRTPCQAAHTGHDGGKSMKADDRTCAPLYFVCHFEYDNGKRSKGLFELDHGISMEAIVRDLNREYESLKRGEIEWRRAA